MTRSYTLWVITQGYKLFQGDEHGDFRTIDTFGDAPQGTVLSADGAYGYVTTDK